MYRQLVYVSNSNEFREEKELHELLRVSRQNNAKKGVTGMLLFHDGLFMQILEGDPEVVTAVYEKISQDPRHRSCRVMADLEVDSREFGDWSMGYVKTEGTLVQGFSDLMMALEKPLDSVLNNTVQNIMNTFRNHALKGMAA